MIYPRSILRTRVERSEVLWSVIRFESKSQRHQAFDKLVGKIMTNSEAVKLSDKIGIRKALNLARGISITKQPSDLECLISR